MSPEDLETPTKGRPTIKQESTERYGKHLGTNRWPAGDHRPIDGTCLPASLVQIGNGLGPAGCARRSADHAPVHLRERRLPRRLRNARRGREPGRPPVASDRAAGDPVLARSSHPLAPIFRLNGGPGVTNMTFPQASRLAAQHDVVMVGYRGVDGSSVLNCPEVTAALDKSADLLAKASLSAYSQAFASCAERLERSGVDLAGYTLEEQAADIEAARVALGYQRIDLLSESAGTRLGDDLLVAVPEQCRPLGDGRGQPARELHLQRSRDRSGDRGLLGAVRAGACLPGPHRQPRRQHAAHGGTHAEQVVLPADQAGQRPGRHVPRAHRGDRFATVRADDPRLVDLRRAWRPERLLAAIEYGRSHPPHVVRLGRVCQHRDGRRPARRPLFQLRRGPGLDHRQSPRRVLVGGRRPGARLAGQPEREPVHQRAELERPDAAHRRDARLRNAGPERHQRAATAPPQRASGHPVRARARGRLLAPTSRAPAPSC